jgi:hypothetical protein
VLHQRKAYFDEAAKVRWHVKALPFRIEIKSELTCCAELTLSFLMACAWGERRDRNHNRLPILLALWGLLFCCFCIGYIRAAKV